MAEAGAGRGLTVPPTAKQMAEIERKDREKADRSVFTVEKIGKYKTPKGEKFPRDLMEEDFKNMEKTPVVKKAKGGTASSRADGCCKRGKTKGKMV